jgi:ATP-dependent exoDNAse (exonuclease V) beta subunit
MTIHKSKGLEFDTVILPGLDKTTGGGEQPLLMWEEVARDSNEDDVADVDLVVAPFIPKSKNKAEQVSIYDYLQSLEKQRADYEDARVLYVAVTRAERCLHLLGAVSPNKDGEFLPKKNTFLEILWPVVAGKFSKEKLAQIQSEQPKQSASQLNASLQDFVPKLVRLSNPAVPSLLQAEVTHEIHQSQAGVPTAKDEEENYLVLEADIGSLTHRYLELIANQGLDAWSASRLEPLKLAMQRWFTGQGYSLSAANQGADAVLALLKTTLQSPHGQWVLQSRETASNELEIESLEDDRSQVRKKIIDRTFVENGVRWIVDYKTISFKTVTFKNSLDEANLKQAAEAYRHQLEGYAVLFADEGLSIQLAVYFVSIGQLVTL